MEKMPAIVTTGEALENALVNECSVIYIDETLYVQCWEYVNGKMDAHGYVALEKVGKHGIFFLKREGEEPFDPEQPEIYDPYDIL